MLKQVIDQVVANCDVAIIARRDAEDAVVMSLDTYNSMMETFHLMKSPTNVKHLEKSLAQYRKGQDKKTLKRINLLIKETMRTPKDGIGKPEAARKSTRTCGQRLS
jgi:antitoxin YefM